MQQLASVLTAFIAAYYLLVISLVYVMSSAELILVFFDLAYDLSSEYRS